MKLNVKVFDLVLLYLLGILQVGIAIAQPERFLGSAISAADYDSIQQAVDALPPRGGIVFIPPGIYEISEPIRIENSDVTVWGAGGSTLLLNTSLDGTNTFEIVGEPGRTKGVWRIQISNLHMKGNEKSGHAIYAFWAHEMLLKDLWIDYHGKSGLYLDRCLQNARVVNNNIAYNRQYGVFSEACHDIIISANELEENGYGLFVKDVYNAVITGNNIDDHIENSVYLVNTYGSIITGNMLENSLKECVVLDEGCNGIVLTGNTLRQPGNLVIRKNRGVTISGNAFDKSYDNAISVEDSELLTISGNIFSDGRQLDFETIYGIVMKNVKDVSITGNTMTKLQTGGIYAVSGPNKHLTITGNTIRNPSLKFPGEFSGIYLENTQHSIVSNNTVLDEGQVPKMKSAIQEAVGSDCNVIMGNRVSQGRSNSIVIKGSHSKSEENLVF
jgi:parallel beta-helix repeat protein